MEQILIVVDDNNNFLQYAPRTLCHTGKGLHHRAIVLLLYNKRKQLLLQQRKHWLWDKIWDLTGATHPLHLESKDESFIESAERCLRTEWGIEGVLLNNIGVFNYFEEHGDSCENEHCALIVGEYNGKVETKQEHAYGFRWVSFKELLKQINQNPKNFTPWLIESVKLIQNNNFGKNLLKK